MGSSYKLESNGEALIYRAYAEHYMQLGTETIWPTVRKWRNFWKKVDELGVWDWHRDYSNPAVVLDGTSWSLELQIGASSVVSHGSNSYPGNVNRYSAEYSSEFGKFLKAVRNLIGGLDFG